MAFVDFSDPEDMFDLLLEYLADEYGAAGDPQRRQFLAGVLGALAELKEQFPDQDIGERIQALRQLHSSVDPQFAGDPAAAHLEDCAAELERVRDDGA